MTAILNTSGTAVVQYSYDAWGNPLTTTGTHTLANLNPLRYRGYVYDNESGFYYTSSRYYNSQVGRFINADSIDFLGANGDFQSFNLYAYCGNNPVCRADSNGKCWNILGGAVLGGLIGVASQLIVNVLEQQPIDEDLLEAAITGAVGGALTAAFPGASTLINVGMSMGESIINDVQEGENLATIATNAALSVGFAAATSGGTVFSDTNIVSNTISAISKALPGNHPKVKGEAIEFLAKTGKEVVEEFVSGVSDGLFVGYVSRATKWVYGLFIGAKSSNQEAFTF